MIPIILRKIRKLRPSTFFHTYIRKKYRDWREIINPPEEGLHDGGTATCTAKAECSTCHKRCGCYTHLRRKFVEALLTDENLLETSVAAQKRTLEPSNLRQISYTENLS